MPCVSSNVYTPQDVIADSPNFANPTGATTVEGANVHDLREPSSTRFGAATVSRSACPESQSLFGSGYAGSGSGPTRVTPASFLITITFVCYTGLSRAVGSSGLLQIKVFSTEAFRRENDLPGVLL